MSERRVSAFGVLLLVDFLITLVMLVTDKNLQTDFGGHPQYYLHWYGALAMGVLDLLAGLTVLAYAAVPFLQRMSTTARKVVVTGALAWTIVAILAMVGIVETYQQVGFQNASQFAQYLFGVTAYPKVLSYIPWLYDLLLIFYLLTAVVGVLAVMQVRKTWSAPPPAEPAH
jgi:hypothetical protein